MVARVVRRCPRSRIRVSAWALAMIPRNRRPTAD